MTLLDWAEGYLRHRDVFEKRINGIERVGDRIVVTRTDGSSLVCVARDALSAEGLEDVQLVVTRNTRANVDRLAANWQSFAALEGLKLVFVHEASGEKWVLVPSSHDRIAEPETLALGLNALFEAVPEG